MYYMNIQELFGHNLERCRKRANLTQNELAQKIGISPSTVFNIEAGTLFVSVDVFQKITDVLHILPEELFYSGSETTPEAVHADVIKKVLASHLKFAEKSVYAGVEL